jgi:hypothetical protein
MVMNNFLEALSLNKLYYIGCPTRYRSRLAGGPLLRVAPIRRNTDTLYTHIPLDFSHNQRTPVQISF